jgi:hypothetical protein
MSDTVWIVELRRDARSCWKPQDVFETRVEATAYRWEPIPPAEQRIAKYVRVEKKKKSSGATL